MIPVFTVGKAAALDTADIHIPGSKSYSMRALFISALCDEPFRINNLLESDDTRVMQACLDGIKREKYDLNAGESGLTARFLAALASITAGEQIISGSSGLKKRPMGDLVDALSELGADIEYMEIKGFLPIKVKSSELRGGKVKLPGNVSSQYLSALLLIAPALPNGLTIEVKGRQISKPYVDITMDIMRAFHVEVKNKSYRTYIVRPQAYLPKDYTVEADYSSASYFLAISYLTGSKVNIANLNPRSKQADKRFAALLTGLQNRKHLPHIVDVRNFPDQAMTLAVLLAFEKGRFKISGVKSLRIKESERVQAVENELAKMGIKTESTADILTIYGGSPRPRAIDTYNDHRIAMSFAVAGAKIGGVEILHPEVVNKTFPGFWKELSKLSRVEKAIKKYSNILLTGMRGSGKSSVGKKLARRLQMDFVDMDEYIERKQKQKIRDIVIKNGWDYFRDIESQACRDLGKRQNTVISSGGGIVLREKNMRVFKDDSLNVLLIAEPKKLSYRIRHDKNRPELSTQPSLLGELGEVWKKRKSDYYYYADLVVDSGAANVNAVVNQILDKINP